MHPCIESYLSRCRPFQLPAPWDCCAVDPNALQGPSQPSAAFSELIAQHGAQALAESGLARLNDAGQLALHPRLAAPDVGIVMLREASTGDVRDLMTETGCVLCDRWPLFEVLADQHTLEVLAGPRRFVLLTGQLADTVVLRSLGLAAAPLVGLDQLSGCCIQWLGHYYGVTCGRSSRERDEAEEANENPKDAEFFDHPGDLLRQWSEQLQAPATPAPPSDDPPYAVPCSGHVGIDDDDDDYVPLTLVRWAPSQLSLEQPPAARRALDYLKQLADYRRLSLSDLHDWRPQPGAFAALQFALARGEASWVKDALLDSLHESMRMIDLKKQRVVAADSPADIRSAMDQMQAALLGDDSAASQRRQKEAVLKYVEIATRQLRRGIMDHMEAASDPLERSLWMQFAELNAIFVAKAPQATRQVLRGIVQGDEDPIRANKSLPELLAISNKLATLTKELSKWRKSFPKQTPQRTVLPPLDLSRRFASSDWAQQN